ncbi:hypothetical protein R2F61_02450 [Mollicutes bacterium LVI A0078]|nr:hypothetical protein R2F61_02450 [Mollicutes bacterium LVI A0078]
MRIYDLLSLIVNTIWQHLIIYLVKQLVCFFCWIKFTIFNPRDGAIAFGKFWQRQYKICLGEIGEDSFVSLIRYYFVMSIFYFFVLITSAILDTPKVCHYNCSGFFYCYDILVVVCLV